MGASQMQLTSSVARNRDPAVIAGRLLSEAMESID